MKAHKTKRQHVYFQSKMNREIIEQYELKESIMNFDQNEFAKDVKEQMIDLGVSIPELSKAVYLPEDRIRNIIDGKGKKANPEEVKIIKKHLSLT
jgi:hypothetical protein